MAGRSQDFWFGEIDAAQGSDTLLVSPQDVVARMALDTLGIFQDPGLGLFFLRGFAPVNLSAQTTGVTAEAVRRAVAQGLIAKASDDNGEVIYALTAEGRRLGAQTDRKPAAPGDRPGSAPSFGRELCPSR